MTSTNLLFPQWSSLSKSLDPFSVGFDDVLNQIRDISETVAKASPDIAPVAKLKQAPLTHIGSSSENGKLSKLPK